MTQHQTRPTICIDLGKTRCRVALIDATGILSSIDGDGVAGAAAPDGATSIARLLLGLIANLDQTVPAVALALGAAGTLTDPDAARTIARDLADALRLPIAVTSDVITAHVGALGGEPGVALIAGTGAVALGLSPAGELSRVDGWGPELGDFGGGSWIGREGIRAVLLAGVGAGEATTLSAPLAALMAPETDPARWLSSAQSGNVGGQLARFAPAVIAAAEAGDGAASGIFARAVSLLATSAAAAAGPQSARAPALRVSVLGGLNDNAYFNAALEAQLQLRGLVPTAPSANALEGAHIIAHNSALPHERYIHRAQ